MLSIPRVFRAWSSAVMVAMFLLAVVAHGQVVNSNNWSTVQPILARNVVNITTPPTQVPGVNVSTNGLNLTDGPVLGNGHVTAAIGGTAAEQTYTITTTDFYNQTLPKIIGSVSVVTPGFDSGASYLQQQDPALGEVRSIFSEGSQSLKIRSIVAATANLLVIQLTNTGSSTITGVVVLTQPGSFAANDSLPAAVGVQASNKTGYITRSTAVSGNPFPGSAALATYLPDGSLTASVLTSTLVGNSLNLAPNTTVNVVVGIGGGYNSTTYLNDAITLANAQTDTTVTSLIAAHEAWWQNFWMSGATVNLGGGPVEKYWYTALYWLACFNRSGQEMAGMLGIQTEDDDGYGGWSTDYNTEDTYLGVFSAGHPELAGSYFVGINQYLPQGYLLAGNSSGTDGVLSDSGIGPGAQNAIPATDWGMHGDAAWLATVYVNYWNYTRNATWASQTGYPWLLAVAHYWDHTLVYENGVYNDIGSAQEEQSSYMLNAIGDLADMAAVYNTLIDMNASGAVTSSASDLALWKTEVANLAPLPTYTSGGLTYYNGTQDAPGGSLGLYGINPAVWSPTIGLGSTPAQIQAMQNTIYANGSYGWYGGNFVAWSFPASARIGLPETYNRFAAALGGRLNEPTLLRSNGTVVQAGGGSETMGSIETVDEMLLSSYDGVLRFFPAWPSARAVSFSDIGATGNFSVSSSLSGGVIGATTVVSNAGRALTIAQSFPGATITITDATPGTVVTGSTATVTAPTVAGHTYNVTFTGTNPILPDLATLGTASASSDIANLDWWAGYANDGQTMSYPTTLGWSSNSNLSTNHTEYYQIDLGTSMAFNEAVLWPRSDPGNVGAGFPSSYNIAVSNDNINWTVAATGKAATPPTGDVIVSLGAQNARYVRVNGLSLTANSSGNYYMQLAEVQLFNQTSAPQNQTITFNPIPSQLAGSTLTLNATASSGLPVSYSVVQNGICSVSGDTVTFLSAGNCGVNANQNGNAFYNAAPTASQIIAVNNPIAQTITFGAIAAQHVGGTLTVSATASSGLPVSFSVVQNGNCSVSGDVVTFLNTGNCGVLANQPGNNVYSAAPQVGQIIVVNSASSTPTAQTITFGAIAAQHVGGTLTLSATASSGLAVTFSIVQNGNCSISGNVVTFLNVGNCGVIANQVGNSTYSAAPSVGQIIVVNAAVSSTPAAQTITFGAIAAQHVGGTLTLSATASSGLAVSYTIVQNGNCNISGNVVTFLNVGNCGVIASQAGNSAYSAAPSVGQIIVVNAAVSSTPAAQTITFNPIPAQVVGGKLSVSATASSGLAVTFILVQNGNCSITGNVVTFLSVGNCGVIATQAGNSSYSAAPEVGQIIVVNQ